MNKKLVIALLTFIVFVLIIFNANFIKNNVKQIITPLLVYTPEGEYIRGENFYFVFEENGAEAGFRVENFSGNTQFRNLIMTRPTGFEFLNEEIGNDSILKRYYSPSVDAYIIYTMRLAKGDQLLVNTSLYSPANSVLVNGNYFITGVSGENYPFRFALGDCGNNFLGSSIGANGTNLLQNWSRRKWPTNTPAPSMGAYNLDSGEVITIIGQHILDGEREYALWIKNDPDPINEDQLMEITVAFYDSVTDNYLNQIQIPANEILSVSYVVEPFLINVGQNQNPLTIDLETKKVMDVSASHINEYLMQGADYSNGLVPSGFSQGLLLDLNSNITQEELGALISKYNAIAGEVTFGDAEYFPCGHTRGIACSFDNNTGQLSPQVNNTLNKLYANNFFSLHYNNIVTNHLTHNSGPHQGEPYIEYVEHPECVVLNSSNQPLYKNILENTTYFNFRNQTCRDYAIDWYIKDYTTYPQVKGVRFDEAFFGDVQEQPNRDPKYGNWWNAQKTFYYGGQTGEQGLVPSLKEAFPEMGFGINGPNFVKTKNALDLYMIGDCMYPGSSNYPEWNFLQFDSRLLDYFYNQITNKKIIFNMGGCNSAVHAIQFGSLKDGPGITYPENLSGVFCAAPKKHQSWFAEKAKEMIEQKNGFNVIEEKIYDIYPAPQSTPDGILPRGAERMVMLSKLRTESDWQDYLVAGAYNTEKEIIYDNLTNLYEFELYFMKNSSVINTVSPNKIEQIKNTIIADDILVANPAPIEVVPEIGNIDVTINSLDSNYLSMVVDGTANVRLTLKKLPANEQLDFTITELYQSGSAFTSYSGNSSPEGVYEEIINIGGPTQIEVSGNLAFIECSDGTAYFTCSRRTSGFYCDNGNLIISEQCGGIPIPYCGDNICNNGETYETCQIDCPFAPVCGDGNCDPNEDYNNCPVDCPTPIPFCGDNICNNGETYETCPVDCLVPVPYCGDGICNNGETHDSCPVDCVAPVYACGDGIDNDGDDLIDFPADPGCPNGNDPSELGTNECDDGIDNEGDGFIDTNDGGCVNAFGSDETNCPDNVCEGGENNNNCPQDCPLADNCGDGTCSGDETFETCPVDCLAPNIFCGDGSCNNGETCSSCSVDCGSCSGDGGGSGGGGGGGGTIVRNIFELDKTQMSVVIKQGETKQVGFNIKNLDTISLNFGISSNLYDMLEFEKNFTIEKSATKGVLINVSANNDTNPELYLAKIKIKTGNVEKEILLSVEVVSKESLFDVYLWPVESKEYAIPGENISFEISMTRIINLNEDNVQINYFIENTDEEVILSESELRDVGAGETFVKTFEIPGDLKTGAYIFYVQVEYDEKIASASAWFNVDSGSSLAKIFDWLKSNVFGFVVFVLIVGIIFIAVAIVRRIRRNRIVFLDKRYNKEF